jgi:hypothetical protein
MQLNKAFRAQVGGVCGNRCLLQCGNAAWRSAGALRATVPDVMTTRSVALRAHAHSPVSKPRIATSKQHTRNLPPSKHAAGAGGGAAHVARRAPRRLSRRRALHRRAPLDLGPRPPRGCHARDRVPRQVASVRSPGQVQGPWLGQGWFGGWDQALHSPRLNSHSRNPQSAQILESDGGVSYVDVSRPPCSPLRPTLMHATGVVACFDASANPSPPDPSPTHAPPQKKVRLMNSQAEVTLLPRVVNNKAVEVGFGRGAGRAVGVGVLAGCVHSDQASLCTRLSQIRRDAPSPPPPPQHPTEAGDVRAPGRVQGAARRLADDGCRPLPIPPPPHTHNTPRPPSPLSSPPLLAAARCASPATAGRSRWITPWRRWKRSCTRWGGWAVGWNTALVSLVGRGRARWERRDSRRAGGGVKKEAATRRERGAAMSANGPFLPMHSSTVHQAGAQEG